MEQTDFSYSAQVFVHKLLWNVVRRQIEDAERQRRGSFYNDLAALIFVAHFVEGYLNYLGEHLDPAVWAQERKNFQGKGFSGKASAIYALLHIPEPDRAQRPYSSIWKAKMLRDQIAHSKPVKRSGQARGGMREFMAETLTYDFGGTVSHVNVLEIVSDVKAVISDLHSAFRAIPGMKTLYADPFDGITSYGDGVS